MTASAHDLVRVLIVDDDEAVVRVLAFALALDQRLSIVGVGRTGSEAVTLARELAPDVILMDVLMPELNGIEATQRLRECDSPARVVLMSGHMGDVDSAAALEAGAVGLLHKPPRVGQLLEAVAHASGLEPQA